MTIRTKTLGITTLALTLVPFLVYAVASPLIMRGFANVEDDDIRENVQRSNDALRADIDTINSKLTDWSNWDDAYDFAATKNKKYIEANLEGSIVNPIFDSQLYFDANNALLYSFDQVERPADLVSRIRESKLLAYGRVNPETDRSYSFQGLLVSNGTVVMLAAQPILRSDGTGPARGTLIFTKYLTKLDQKAISERTHLDVSIYGAADSSNPADVRSVVTAGRTDEVTIHKTDQNTTESYAFLEDVSGQPGVVVKTMQNRAIYQQGLHSIRLFSFVLVGAGIIFLLVTILLLEIMVVRRLTRLTEEVTAIKGDTPQAHTLRFKGNDEVSKLAVSMNGMLSRIKISNQRVHQLVTELRHEKAGVEKQVTERTAELNSQRDRFLSSINSLPLGFIMMDENGKVLMLNPSLERVLKVPDITMGTVETVMQDTSLPLRPLLVEARTSLRTRKAFSKDLRAPDGRFLHMLAAPVISIDGRTEGVVVLTEDITETKILARSKEEFFSIASHELRTPLTAIRGNTQMIRDFYKEPLKDDGLREMIDDIYESSVRLIGIVNDFLDVSSLEQGKMKFVIRDFSIGEVVGKVVDEMANVAQDKAVNIVVDKGFKKMPKVHGDDNRVKQVIYNLVGNSLKFTHEGTITISGEVMQDKGLLKVSVTDTGPGISPEGQQLLFHKFQQTNENLYTRDTIHGTGLGLYISKLIVENMGGTIGLDASSPDTGTTFSFTIPLADS